MLGQDQQVAQAQFQGPGQAGELEGGDPALAGLNAGDLRASQAAVACQGRLVQATPQAGLTNTFTKLLEGLDHLHVCDYRTYCAASQRAAGSSSFYTGPR